MRENNETARMRYRQLAVGGLLRADSGRETNEREAMFREGCVDVRHVCSHSGLGAPIERDVVGLLE